MKRTILTALLALAASAGLPSASRAQPCTACANGPRGPYVPPPLAGGLHDYPKNVGFGSFCFNLLGHIHAHGPLYNYGPYEGYYPFAPYGPWNSDLSYNGEPNAAGGNCGPRGCGNRGPKSQCGWNLPGHGGRERGSCGAGGCGASGCGSGLGHFAGLGHKCGAGGCGAGLTGGFGHGCPSSGCNRSAYSVSTLKNVFVRCHPLCHRAKISTGCAAAPASGCGDCGSSALGGGGIQSISAELPPEDGGAVRGFRER